MKVELSTKVMRSPEPMTTSVGDEVLMFSAEKGKYFGMNPVASAMWNRMETPVTIQELCTELQAKYDVSAEQCTTEVVAFVEKLVEKGLVQVTSS